MDASLIPAPAAECSTPAPAPLGMPTQSLDRTTAGRSFAPGARVILARLVAVGGAAALAWYGYGQMMLVFGNETSTALQLVLLALFTVTFGWIAF
ncbi:MAG TPA: glucans biosynthesis glucosyltransferase MdoH, partial [Paracoccaceae bacterium]|nr:glucans biosynthesis glucosyltransferase MdoH [Paracoccaceae bacterium]